ncbi:hypothetical protein QFC22_004061 [Naganishia vaughanmartiniae]|uniref:Uncharacterized protein n=1 Tax=Naganishia vaughanmartiniae TaxID=1424756 RepID=A0ACC2X5X4_9TREE|nr:hypothetical protein QFC22_004061 [Naganishia vaughanmartiniae]
MSQPPVPHHNPYPNGHGPSYDSRRPSGSYPPQPIPERLPPILDQPPRYHASQSYPQYPTYAEGSRVYHAQTPPLPPPVQHPRPDYRYSSLGGLPTPQQSYNNAPPMNDRDYVGYYKKRKLSSDISVYSLSVNNGGGEEIHPRLDTYSKNPSTPNISTPSSSGRPPEELGATRDRSQMTEQDKHELKKEKNREKQRRLRSRRAEQMNTLEHLNAEKDARLEHLEAKVKQLEAEAMAREERWQTWVTELESRLTQARRRCRVLEAASMGQKENEGDRDLSASREIADVRVRFGVEAANGIDPSLSYSTSVLSDNMRVDPALHHPGEQGMYRANVPAAPVGREQPRPQSAAGAASPRDAEYATHTSSRPTGIQTTNDRFRHSGSPLSIQALVSPSAENMQSATGSFSTEGTRTDMNTAVSHMIGESNKAKMMDTVIARGFQQVVASLEDVDPNVALPYLHLLNSLQPMPNQPIAFPKVTMLRNPEIDGSSQVSTQVQHPTAAADSVDAATANMPESEILSMPETNLLHLARSLIQEKLPSSMYTPQQGQWNTTMEHEQSKFNLRQRNPSDATTLVGEDQDASFIRPNWRQTFTPSQLYILYRALMFACHPSGSKEFFDGKRLSELSAGQKAVYERWAAYEGRDKRLDMVPAMILRMRIILCDELQDRGDFDLTAYMCDTLHEAVSQFTGFMAIRGQCTAGNWWTATFPAGRDFCSALRAWRRKDRHPGARPFEIIMGTEAPEVRRKGGLELPPVGWSDGLIPDHDII